MSSVRCSGECPAGYYCTVQTTVPLQCPVGTFSNLGQSNCSACPRGFSTRSKEAAIKCTKCESGRYTTLQRSGQCSPCPTGKFQPKHGSTTCKRCPDGYFGTNEGGKKCTMARPGLRAPPLESGAVQEIDCVPGTFSAGGSTKCLHCPKGWFQSDYGKASCEKCPAGKTTIGDEGFRFCKGLKCLNNQYLNNFQVEKTLPGQERELYQY